MMHFCFMVQKTIIKVLDKYQRTLLLSLSSRSTFDCQFFFRMVQKYVTLHAKTRLIKHCKLVKPGFKRFQNPQNRVSKGFRTHFSRVSNGFPKGFERVSKGFRTSFQRVSRGFRTGFQRVFKVFPKLFQRKQGFPKGF